LPSTQAQKRGFKKIKIEICGILKSMGKILGLKPEANQCKAPLENFSQK